ncbi:MAG: sigma-70 family RNA polymerase sigma factor [Spirochaetaceae bacterium]|nr:sigma-70 family RNA polymerase sigma factor [Spirochaetaceae bacterium]
MLQNPFKPNPQKRDLKIIRDVLAGEKSRFSELVIEYAPRVKAFARRFFRNESDLDDLLQEVFVKAYSNLGTFRGNSLFSTWLLRITYTTAINVLNRTRADLPLPEYFDEPSPNATPDEVHMRGLAMEAVREAVSDLPEVCKQCILMYFFDGLQYSDIAEILDLPLNTVKSHIFRAKKNLSEKLKDEK